MNNLKTYKSGNMKKQEHRLKKKAMKAGKFVSLMLFLQQRVVAQELQMG